MFGAGIKQYAGRGGKEVRREVVIGAGGREGRPLLVCCSVGDEPGELDLQELSEG